MHFNKFLIATTIFLSGFSLSVAAQNRLSDDTKLGLFLREDFEYSNDVEWAVFENDFNMLIEKLQEKRGQFRSDEIFLRFVFYKVHRKFLGEYKQYVAFGEIFKKDRQYDCVTGTALYALILDTLGFEYEIRETDYHVYLLAKTEGKSILFESTDPIYGFSTDAKEISARRAIVIDDAKRINRSLALSGVAAQNEENQKVSIIDNQVSLIQLAGLHYYNQALKQFNERDYREAYKFAIIAQGIYPSKRIKHASSYMFAVAFED